MAEQITHDVVKEAQSMGGPSPIDDTASTTNTPAGNGQPLSRPNKHDSAPAADATTIHATVSNSADIELRPPEPAVGSTGDRATNSDGQVGSEVHSKEAKETLVNGDAGDLSTSESQTANGEGSGGSDTDVSRPGSVDQAKQPGGHLRTNSSLKKPPAFKSVSVTKNFLAKSAVSTPVVRPGDKVAPSTATVASAPQTARPRLVAKSGGSNKLRTLGKLNGADSGPDASKVWNKNQPVPPAPPKQFTDEELQQHYGIHLATRLQADEAGKEAKWADIDDDEDDWAPETVEWMDGTKSTVAAENQPPPPEEPKSEPDKAVKAPAEIPAPAPAPATQRSGLTGGTKTILKPGASAQAIAAKPKGQLDKPTLVAKPSSAAPVKSPWAPLPPVEKVSPVQINPPQQPPTSRYPRESYGYDDVQHGPAKEIAPDDFNRAWRDERGNRELFNSHSGRYEPVADIRRGSIRENVYRQQPSVLQRPSQDGPAEPSAAFQTSRSSVEGPGWGRRRNSSNVSGSSGRRMSFDRRGPELPTLPGTTQQRELQPVNGVDTSAAATSQSIPSTKGGPVDQQPSAQPTSVQLADPTPAAASNVQPTSPFGSAGSQDAVTTGAPSQMQNLVEVQERLLHSNLDAIKLRKQKEKEQEAQEEAERKERLRKRLEEMGHFNKQVKAKKEESPSRTVQKQALKDKAAPAPVQSPPKPPIPTADSKVAQYGMMKVHQPQPVNRKPGAAETSSKSAVSKLNSSPVKTPAETQSKSLPSIAQATEPATTIPRDSDKSKPSAEHQQPHAQQSRSAIPSETKAGQPSQAPWSTTLPSQRPVGWGLSSSGSSVWGPPQARDRALGNGTFGQQAPPSSQANAPPIGLKTSTKNAATQPPAAPMQQYTPQNIYTQPVPTLPQAGAVSKTVSKPGPIAPPPTTDKGWGNFQAHIRQDDRDVRAKAERERDRLGPDFRPELRETYTDHQGNSDTIMHQRVGGIEPANPQASTAPDVQNKHEVPKAHDSVVPAGQAVPHQPATQGGRSSRFFPKPQPTSKHESPPPPETESHPAFSGDTTHPVVKMPKPSPRVRLPPATVGPTAQAEAAVSMPSRSRPGLGARPLALTQEWQARFKSLLEKPSIPDQTCAPIARPPPPAQASLQTKPGSMAIAPSSKAPLEVRNTSISATVSLPHSASQRGVGIDSSSEFTTRSGTEDLLEDREFGSLPTLRLPKTPHLAANEPSAGFPSNTRQHSRHGNKLYVTSKPTLSEDKPDRHESAIDVVIRIGNIREPVKMSIPFRRRGAGRPSQPKSRRNPSNGTNNALSSGQNTRSRKPSNLQGQSMSPDAPSRGATSNKWSNSRSTTGHTNPWTTKRQPPAAPVH